MRTASNHERPHHAQTDRAAMRIFTAARSKTAGHVLYHRQDGLLTNIDPIGMSVVVHWFIERVVLVSSVVFYDGELKAGRKSATNTAMTHPK